MSINLPAINGASQDRAASPYRPSSRMENVPPIPDAQAHSTKYNNTFQQLANVPFPAMNHEASVKMRISTLEAAAEAQADFNQTACRTFTDLNGSLHGAEDLIKLMLKQAQDAFDARLAQMKKEYDHRFDLQATENKRLQNHVSNLKGDTTILKNKLQSTIEKLRKLQHEFGDPDTDFDEESSMVFSATGMGGSLSRPHTSQHQL